jgi:ABC-type bacteriocin/lantibiotic exporters, contain an N-terminal double-glycine peptidase domain
MNSSNMKKNQDLLLSIFKILKFKISILFFLIFICALTSPIISVLFKSIIDILIYTDIKVVDMTMLKLIFLYGCVSIVNQNIESIIAYMNISISYIIDEYVISKLLDKMNIINLAELENSKTYDIFGMLSQNLAEEIKSVIINLSDIVESVITIITFSLIVFKLNYIFLFIIALSTVPYIAIVLNQGSLEYFYVLENSGESRRFNYFVDVLSSRKNAKEIRFLGIVNFFIDKISSLQKVLWKKKYKLLLNFSMKTISASLIRNVSLGICLFISIREILEGKYGVGNITILVSAIECINNCLSTLVVKIGKKNKIEYLLRDWDKFITSEDEYKGYETGDLDGCIIFEDVDFSYPGSDKPVFESLNFSIEKGETVAIVGENGSGKSTIVKLLLGIFNANAGKILINNFDNVEVIESFRNNSACLFQEYNKYQMTIGENIKLGNTENCIYTDTLTRLRLYDFINKYSDGMDTIIGQINDGVELSGGEWQKLAILRALNKKDVKFIIFDEPTANLDPISEMKFYMDIKQYYKEATVVIVSHRLAVSKICDKIIVIDGGKVAEIGSHQELVERQGIYSKMFLTQKELYKA